MHIRLETQRRPLLLRLSIFLNNRAARQRNRLRRDVLLLRDILGHGSPLIHTIPLNRRISSRILRRGIATMLLLCHLKLRFSTPIQRLLRMRLCHCHIQICPLRMMTLKMKPRIQMHLPHRKSMPDKVRWFALAW